MRQLVCLVFLALSVKASLDFQTKVLLKMYEDCSRTDWQSCLKIKLLTSLEKFRNVQAIPVIDGLTFVDENFIPDNSASSIANEKVLEDSLPRKIDDRNELLNSLLMDKFFNFFSKYTLRWKLSELTTNEGRGKGKKYSHLLMMPMMMAASFVPIALGALALLAGKALIVGKMALLLVSILGIRKLFSNSHDEDEHQRAMKRISDFGMRLKSDMMAHKMAYRSQQANDLNNNMTSTFPLEKKRCHRMVNPANSTRF